MTSKRIITVIIASAAVLILAIAGMLGAKIYSYSKIEVRGVDSVQLEDMSLKGFSVKGDILVYNGGITSVSIDSIVYNITLESTGELLSQGYVEGKKISAKETEKFGFSNDISWLPSVDTAIGLATSDEVYVVVSGNVYVNTFLAKISLPFEKKVDIKPYVIQFAQEKIESIGGKVGMLIESLGSILG